MTTLREVAQQALEALETVFMPHHPAVISLRAALEQPEQEPVAWMVYTQDGKSVCVTDNPADFIEWRSFPLYTHPPRREWRGLNGPSNLEIIGFARAIEAALRSKNYE